jgi:hypothetical protein
MPMLKLTVKRKQGAPRITRFSVADWPSLEFAEKDDTFEVPIEYIELLGDYFEVTPVSNKKKSVEAQQ